MNNRLLVSLHGTALHHIPHLLATHKRYLLHHLPQLDYYFWTFDRRLLGAGGGFYGKRSLCTQTIGGTYALNIYNTYPIFHEESYKELICLQ